MTQRQLSDGLFLAIAHPVRRGVLDMLAEADEVPVSVLQARFDITKSALSQHLRALTEVALVADRREGRRVFYRLTPEPLVEVIDWLQDFRTNWERRLDSLGVYLSEQDRLNGITSRPKTERT